MRPRAATDGRRSGRLSICASWTLINKDTGSGLTVVVGVALPGLGLEEGRPIRTVLPGNRTNDE